MKPFKIRSSRLSLLIVTLLTIPFFIDNILAQSYSNQFAAKESRSERNVLWEASSVTKRDLFAGPGGKEMRPNLKNITFIKEEKGGGSKKFRIKDGAGKEWVVKVGNESQSETAAVRLIWGLGYKTEINYLEPSLQIPGKGTFKNVRFEARPEKVERDGRWAWSENPFSGTKELKGLLIMMALMNNWDLKDEGNNVLLRVKTKGATINQYVISDLGATFGRTGYINFPIFWRFGRHKNKPDYYLKSKFIKKVDDGEVKFAYAGRNPGLLDDISVEDTYWITGLLSELSQKQIRDAFRAANYTHDEITTLAQGVNNRISELKQLKRMKVAE